MQEIMNGKQIMPFPPGSTPHHALQPPHHAYMPMSSMSAASFSPSISPNSSVLMTPKSAGAHQFNKPHHSFVLHHPTASSSPPNVTPYGQSHSAPWTSQNQFVFPSPTAMTFSNNPPPLTSSSHTNNSVLPPQQWL